MANKAENNAEKSGYFMDSSFILCVITGNGGYCTIICIDEQSSLNLNPDISWLAIYSPMKNA